MKMKKIIALLSSIVMVFAFTACMGSGGEEPPEVNYEGTPIADLLEFDVPDGYKVITSELDPEMHDDYEIGLGSEKLTGDDTLAAIYVSIASYKNQGIAVRDEVPVDLEYLLHQDTDDSAAEDQTIDKEFKIDGRDAYYTSYTFNLDKPYRLKEVIIDDGDYLVTVGVQSLNVYDYGMEKEGHADALKIAKSIRFK